MNAFFSANRRFSAFNLAIRAASAGNGATSGSECRA